jgi:acetate kinase
LKVHGASHRAEIGSTTSIEERLYFAFDLLVQGDTRVLNELSDVAAVAHRIVHGGARYAEAVEIDDEVEKEIERLGALSPLHNPVQLQGIKAAKKKFGSTVRQVAVFDTAFHQSLPPEAKTYAGGILIYLLRNGMKVDDLDDLLNEGSGLSGLAGLPGDTRIVIPEADKGNDRARLALDVFVHRLRAGIGGMIASMGGCDALVFTDAIGESEPSLRAAACAPFSFLGLKLDPKKNQQTNGDTEISSDDSKVRVFVIESRESWQVAQEACALCQNS